MLTLSQMPVFYNISWQLPATRLAFCLRLCSKKGLQSETLIKFKFKILENIASLYMYIWHWQYCHWHGSLIFHIFQDTMGWGENDRGVSFTFGSEVAAKFLHKHDFDLICRAHQVVEDGYEFFAKRQLVTLFSAPNYCGEFDNAGAMMSVDETLMCSFQILKVSIRVIYSFILELTQCKNDSPYRRVKTSTMSKLADSLVTLNRS